MENNYPGSPLGKGEVRILHLLPGNWEDGISFRLSRRSLDSTAEIDYEALSYTWGSTERPMEIRCFEPGATGDSSQSKPFLITSNLFVALRRLRRPDRERVLWIDAISINQHDPGERGSQVQLMGRIYQKATEVLIWLGDTDKAHDWHLDQGPTAEESREDIGSFWTRRRTRAVSEAIQATVPIWFERFWVIQEFALATSSPIACAGPMEFPYEYLEIEHFEKVRSPQEFKAYAAFISKLRMIRERRQNMNLMEIFEVVGGKAKASDERDYIYSLLGLLQPEIESAKTIFASIVSADYTIEAKIVFARATYASILSGTGVRVLNSIVPGRQRDLPSWVVDFAQPAKVPEHMDTTFQRFLSDSVFQNQKSRHRNALLCRQRINPDYQLDDQKGLISFTGLFFGRIQVVDPESDENNYPLSLSRYTKIKNYRPGAGLHQIRAQIPRTPNTVSRPDGLYEYTLDYSGSVEENIQASGQRQMKKVPKLKSRQTVLKKPTMAWSQGPYELLKSSNNPQAPDDPKSMLTHLHHMVRKVWEEVDPPGRHWYAHAFGTTRRRGALLRAWDEAFFHSSDTKPLEEVLSLSPWPDVPDQFGKVTGVTEHGFLVASDEIEVHEGDVIALLVDPGPDPQAYPAVLRPQSGNLFSLVGFAYVHGVSSIDLWEKVPGLKLPEQRFTLR